VRIDWKPLLKADDGARLFANTFNIPRELAETALDEKTQKNLYQVNK